MFKKILIANRGEIAVRIIRACREMGIKTVAVYSKMDQDSLHVKLADEAVCIGKALPKDSYLLIENIISAAVCTGSEAIHPGFGFLSENAKFARICRECNITFIGPSPEVIDTMGDKAKARELMTRAGVPVVPGSKGIVETPKIAIEAAKKIGYPVMLKASAGGGGRGMRIVWHEEEIEKAFLTASGEAKAAFGDGAMYMEKYIEKPRHIEFQILGDHFGNIIHLGERDCSMQRRHQKMIEETPCITLSAKLRSEMGKMATAAASAANYYNAGTVEFIMDKEKNFYFIEMNTRIQVEHPVTEMVTGIDLIKEQIRIAAGEKLSVSQEKALQTGHAIECRINAENPMMNFRPCAGTITGLHFPGGRGVRVDTGIYCGYKVPPTYDAMLAKIITYGKDRSEALEIMKRALAEVAVEGIDTNIEFLYELVHTEAFEEGAFDTSYIENNIETLLGERQGEDEC
ncbi:MAG: acetyl-CoA carboxylase biotin carboxylase subunit [Cellulosilyticaceae bacterium]